MKKYLILTGMLSVSICLSGLIWRTKAKPDYLFATSSQTPLQVAVLRPQTRTNSAQPTDPTEAEIKDFFANTDS